MTLQPNQIIKNDSGETRKVLEILTNVVLISDAADYGVGMTWVTEETLRKWGYTWDVPKWKPKVGEWYWYICGDGLLTSQEWNNYPLDMSRRDFLGVYPTPEAAEAALVEIKNKLKV